MFDAVTVNGARALGLDSFGLAPGCQADMVVLQAKDVHEAIRLRPARLHVIREGKMIASRPPVASRLELGDRIVTVDFLQ
jgi:cytosine deaminase